jgi:hypothetical protein
MDQMFERLKKQKGISLVILIIMVVFVGIMVAGIHAFLAENIRLSDVEKQRARALYLAEMGISDSFWELKYSEKLYGLPSQPYGQIDQQTVNFFDGSSGTYEVPEPTDSILSTGVYQDITRILKVGIGYSTSHYTFFAGSVNDFTFAKNSEVTGSVFLNSSLTVTTPTNIDTCQMTLYLPSGETAQYSSGNPFPYTTLNDPPSFPGLDTSYYDSLLNQCSTMPIGDSTWNDRSLPDTVWINGNLTINMNKTISASGSSSIVVVTGSVIINKNVRFGDSIQLITQNGITCDKNIRVGTTTGQSGNLFFTKTNSIEIGQNNIFNGSLVSNNNLTVQQQATLNGFVYVKNSANIKMNLTTNGCFWGYTFAGNTTNDNFSVIWNSNYIPDPLPPGVGSVGSTILELVQNSWREL